MCEDNIPYKERLAPVDVGGARAFRLTISHSGRQISFLDCKKLWRTDENFCRLFSGWLTSVPFTAFRWELPVLRDEVLDQLFECVIIEDADLDRAANVAAFSREIKAAVNGFAEFNNVSGDALLIIPSKSNSETNYAHLAAFLRTAPASQVLALWPKVGDVLERTIIERPVWLSTSGAGVPWLHIRLDSRPKYYRYDSYRKL